MKISIKNHKKMFWVYTILAGVFGVLTIICGILANYHDRKIDKEPPAQLESRPNIYNVKGNLVQGNTTETNTYPTPKPYTMEDKKPTNSEPQTIINNNGGNFVNGNVSGNLEQNINNYGSQPRHLNDGTKNDLNSIPKDFKIVIWSAYSEEAINYSNEILAYLQEDLKFTDIQVEKKNWIQGWDEAGEKRQAESFNLVIKPDEKIVIIAVQKR